MYPERTFSVKDEAVHPMGLAFNNSCDKLENAQKIMDLFIKENAYDPQKEVVIEGKPQSFTYELCRMIKHHFYKWKNSYKPDLTLLQQKIEYLASLNVIRDRTVYERSKALFIQDMYDDNWPDLYAENETNADWVQGVNKRIQEDKVENDEKIASFIVQMEELL